MTSYQGNIVIKNPATPTGPAQTGSAPGIWKLNEALAFKRQGIWPTQGVQNRDPYFSYVTMLLSTTSLNGAQNNTFLDSSANNFTITRVGNPTQGSVNPYGANWSNYFDGSGDYLSVPYNTAFNVPGNFTVEAWIYQTSRAADQTVINRSGVDFAQFSSFEIIILSNGTARFQQGSGSGTSGTQAVITSTTTVPLSTWTHLAAVKNGSTISLYINGVQAATGSAGTNDANTSSSVFIGARAASSLLFTGYISNTRVVKGTAVYTSAFTPPTAPLTAITNTSLLTCQSNRFIDNSTNNFTITRNGDVTVTVFSPFSPSAAYSTANGGSSYLPGGANNLTAASNAALGFGSGDFTVEFWFYYASGSLPSDARYISFGSTSGCLNITQRSGGIGIVNEAVSHILITSTNFDIGAWNHLAFTRSGSTLRLFKNGVQFGTTTSSAGNSTGEFYLLGAGLTGYFSSVRVVKGTALYTSNFTPNTTPLTAISGTSILLNGTNAGAFDAATINDMETVGNAQVSTAVSKFGGSSLYLDGTTDYAVVPTTPAFGYGTGNFTIEFWLYPNSTVAQTVVSNLTSASSTNPHIYIASGGSIRYYTAGADRITGSTLSTGQWYHIAISRASGSTKMFINGTQSGSTYTDANNYGTTAPLGIGTYWSGSSPFTTNTLNGYIDDLRITNGVARYTTTFIPPTQAFVNY